MTADSIHSRPTILVVDDAPENIAALKGVLGEESIVRPAISGRVALKAAVVEPLPDLILLDVVMPEMDGYTVYQHLRADIRTRDIPVIFVTGRAEESDEIRGLGLGAVDYITKPFSPPIVRARIRTHLCLRAATQTIAAQNQTLRAERTVIENILLRMRSADCLDDRHLRHLSSPVERTAGDVLLAALTLDGRQMVLLGDFTGHGLAAAIGGPLVSYIFQSLVAQGGSAQVLMREINNQLALRLPADMFFAACLVEVAASRRNAVVFNAGLPGGILVRGASLLREIPSQALPLGIKAMTGLPPPGVVLELEPEDRLFLYTDGVIETRSRRGEMFGSDRLAAFLTAHAAPGGALAELFAHLRHFCDDDRRHDDDITLVEIRP
ncbi:MAG: fused response regulator/phosphatase [Magnetococcales bacterium]|nr:fused response regulator/phosphatase [Magnetococcales bacterium]